MLRKRILIAATMSLAACSGPKNGASPDSYALCSKEWNTSITIDYRHKAGSFIDIFSAVRRCSSASPTCMSFPIPFDKPPRLPAGKEIVRWSVGPYRFDARNAGDSDLLINALWEGRDRSFVYSYSTKNGLRRMDTRQTGSESESWSTCYGRLTFDELPMLLEGSRTDPEDTVVGISPDSRDNVHY